MQRRPYHQVPSEYDELNNSLKQKFEENEADLNQNLDQFAPTHLGYMNSMTIQPEMQNQMLQTNNSSMSQMITQNLMNKRQGSEHQYNMASENLLTNQMKANYMRT